jgi:hypothetical protein
LPGFIVDDQQGAIVEFVDAVQAQVKAEPCDADGAGNLGFGDFKADASGFIIQLLGHQAGEASLLKFQIAMGHALAEFGA